MSALIIDACWLLLKGWKRLNEALDSLDHVAKSVRSWDQPNAID